MREHVRDVGELQPAFEQRRVGQLQLVSGGDELGRRPLFDPRFGAEISGRWRRRSRRHPARARRRSARSSRRARAPAAAATRPLAARRRSRVVAQRVREVHARRLAGQRGAVDEFVRAVLAHRAAPARASPARRRRSRPGRRGSRASARRRPAGPPTSSAPSASETAAALHASGRNAHSVFHAAPSRSCSPTRPSSASPAPARTTRASVTRCSERSGLRFCGIVMLPTTPSVGASDSSPISGRWRL